MKNVYLSVHPEDSSSLRHRRMKNLTAVFAIFFLLIGSGCASMFNSSRQAVYVDSDPKGADVKSNKLPRAATTPTSFAFDKGGDLTVSITKDSYVEQSVVVHKRITPSFWANLLWVYFFPIGMLVDAASGSMWNYDENVYVKLEPKNN